MSLRRTVLDLHRQTNNLSLLKSLPFSISSASASPAASAAAMRFIPERDLSSIPFAITQKLKPESVGLVADRSISSIGQSGIVRAVKLSRLQTTRGYTNASYLPEVHLLGDMAEGKEWMSKANGVTPAIDPRLLSSVVQIFTVCRTEDPLHRASPVGQASSGSGFVISGRRILTNAHVVFGATLVEVKRPDSGIMFKAKIRFFGHCCDLALLVIEEDGFWNELQPLELLEFLPNLSQPVIIAGYPSGGDGMCITSGIVSRVDTRSYSHSKLGLRLPSLQVDAAINPGNSGGPVFVGEKVIGIAFQKCEVGDNIGFVIPSPIVRLFLRSSEYGRPSKKEIGFCTLGISTQPMRNPMLRSYFGMAKNMSGVLVTGAYELSQVEVDLKKDDIILQVDGNAVDDDGKLLFDKRIHIHLDGYIALKKADQGASLKILRDRVIKNLPVELIPMHEWIPSPSYFIFAGLVFTEYIFEGVIISQVLEDEVNVGYTSLTNRKVIGVNGKALQNIQQLCDECIPSTV